MPKQLKSLSRLKPKQIQTELTKQQWPLPMRTQLYEQALALKKHRKQTRLREAKHHALWHRVMAPLKYELSNAKVGLRLKNSITEPQRVNAFAAYIEVMEKLIGGMERIKRDNPDQTPTDFAKSQNYPRNGVHWTDWLSEKTKTRIHMAFDAIPYKPRVKRFTPFTRRMTPALYASEHARLWLRTLNEYDLLLSNLNITQEQPKRDALEKTRKRMLFAFDRLQYSTKYPCLPFTWHGLYTEDEWVQLDNIEDPVLLEHLEQTYHDALPTLLEKAREERE
jgi:hypothetical protein